MRNVQAIVWGKVLLLAALLNACLFYPNVSADTGLSWTRSLFLVFVEAPNPGRHAGHFAIGWTKVAFVIVVIGIYSIAVVTWALKGYCTRKKGVLIFTTALATSALIVLSNWSDLAFGFRDPNALRPSRLFMTIDPFLRSVEGWLANRIITLIAVQSLLSMGVIAFFEVTSRATETPKLG